MYALLLIPAVALAVILALSLAPLFDFRRRPLPGTVGTCAFGALTAQPERSIYTERELEDMAAVAQEYGL